MPLNDSSFRSICTKTEMLVIAHQLKMEQKMTQNLLLDSNYLCPIRCEKNSPTKSGQWSHNHYFLVCENIYCIETSCFCPKGIIVAFIIVDGFLCPLCIAGGESNKWN
jgi:hypothetical protein